MSQKTDCGAVLTQMRERGSFEEENCWSKVADVECFIKSFTIFLITYFFNPKNGKTSNLGSSEFFRGEPRVIESELKNQNLKPNNHQRKTKIAAASGVGLSDLFFFCSWAIAALARNSINKTFECGLTRPSGGGNKFGTDCSNRFLSGQLFFFHFLMIAEIHASNVRTYVGLVRFKFLRTCKIYKLQVNVQLNKALSTLCM